MFTVTRRHNPESRREAYILKEGKFFVGLRAKVCAGCFEVIQTVCNELNEGGIQTLDEAKERITALSAASG